MAFVAKLLAGTAFTGTAYFSALYYTQVTAGFALPPSATGEVNWTTSPDAINACLPMAETVQDKMHRMRNGAPRVNDATSRNTILAAIRKALNTDDAVLATEMASNGSTLSSSSSSRTSDVVKEALVKGALYHFMLDAAAALYSKCDGGDPNNPSHRQYRALLERIVAVTPDIDVELNRHMLQELLHIERTWEDLRPPSELPDFRSCVFSRVTSATVDAAIVLDEAKGRAMIVAKPTPNVVLAPRGWAQVAFDFIPKGRAHKGAAHDFDAIWQQIKPKVLELTADRTKKLDLVLVGHSIGADVSQLIAAACVSEPAIRTVRLYTTGAGRVFDVATRDALSRAAKVSHLRIFLEHDRLAFFPFAWMGFQHWGAPVPVALPRRLSHSWLHFVSHGFVDPFFHSGALYAEAFADGPRFLQVSHPGINPLTGRRYQ